MSHAPITHNWSQPATLMVPQNTPLLLGCTCPDKPVLCVFCLPIIDVCTQRTVKPKQDMSINHKLEGRIFAPFCGITTVRRLSRAPLPYPRIVWLNRKSHVYRALWFGSDKFIIRFLLRRVYPINQSRFSRLGCLRRICYGNSWGYFLV